MNCYVVSIEKDNNFQEDIMLKFTYVYKVIHLHSTRCN